MKNETNGILQWSEETLTKSQDKSNKKIHWINETKRLIYELQDEINIKKAQKTRIYMNKQKVNVEIKVKIEKCIMKVKVEIKIKIEKTLVNVEIRAVKIKIKEGRGWMRMGGGELI